mgnify:CR=1 FL=1
MNDRLCILIVGVDPSLSRGVSRLLRQGSHQVLEATSGEEGLHLAAEHRPELLLVSVDLPDVDGVEFCRQLKTDQALAGSLVVLLSAIKTSSEDQAPALECGADGYIVQPIPNRVFLARVEAFLRLQQTLAERDAPHPRGGARRLRARPVRLQLRVWSGDSSQLHAECPTAHDIFLT